jgi:ABC-type antimicrobial peptide transport system permease subunit
MIFSYFISFCKANKIKIITLILSIAVYFALSAVLVSLNKTLPEVASLPFQKIGVGVVVQKTGQIPSHMTGAIFPHSNGPIYENELQKLSRLDFVESQDSGLYFWYFGDKYFKTALGVKPNNSTFSNLLKQNVEQGKFDLSEKSALITVNFAQKNNLTIGNKINFGEKSFEISGILKPNLTGNIIPADIYINLDEARNIVVHSEEMQRIYKFKDKNFVNVVALDANPKWQGDKEKEIKKLDKNYLVFSEKTFNKEALEQIKLVSSLGKTMFVVLGIILLIIFSLLVSFNFKTREKEIAVLRMIGWSFKDLKKQFMAEGMVLVITALVLGNLLAAGSLFILSQQKVSLELPWEISAKPHFLPQENAINRTITANLPIHFDVWIFVWISLAFFMIFAIINYIAFQKLKNIKPARFLK